MGKRKLTPERRAYLRWRISEQRRKLKLKAVEYKGGSCEKCGYQKSIGALAFHHLNPEEKDFGIGNGNSRSWEVIKPELDKCILLCSNCHAEVHDEIFEKQRQETYRKVRELVPEKKINSGSVFKQCFKCKKKIKVYKSAENKRNFCSRKCSDSVIYQSTWIEGEELLSLAKEKTVKEIATMYGKHISTVYFKLKKIKANNRAI